MTSSRDYGNVFIGDCGVGKSTLINTLVEKIATNSGEGNNGSDADRGAGVSSLTTEPVKLAWRANESHGKQYIIDTRGLSSINRDDRTTATKQLDNLFSQPMQLKIIFVVRFDNGRPRFHDAHIIEAVLGAIERSGAIRNDKVNIIVNKCGDDVIQQSKSFGQMFDRTICNERMKVLLGRRYTSPHVLYIQQFKSLHNARNGTLSNRQELATFINKANMSMLGSESSSNVNMNLDQPVFERMKVDFDHRVQSFEMKFHLKLKPPLSFVISPVLPHIEALSQSMHQLEQRFQQLEQQHSEVTADHERMKLEVQAHLTSTPDSSEMIASLQSRIEALELQNQQLKDDHASLLARLHSDESKNNENGSLIDESDGDIKHQNKATKVENGGRKSPDNSNGDSNSVNPSVFRTDPKSSSSLRQPNSRIPKMKRRK